MKLPTTLEAALPLLRDRAETALGQSLPVEGIQPERLHDAMRYAVLGGGKRLRPVLVYATGYALDQPLDALDTPAVAVELIHAYSLVHDDLPAMDDDDLRRGKPSCHRAFDEATAILVGDALQALAFQRIADAPSEHLSALAKMRMISVLAGASGSRGMVGGQAMDLAAVGQRLNEAELESMHIHKTGALIRASVQLGALTRDDCDAALLTQLDHYAKCIGLAFQIQDDILDVEGNSETMGKGQGSDQRLDKPTYPEIIGLDASRELSTRLVDDAASSLDGFDHQADLLRDIARFIVHRDH